MFLKHDSLVNGTSSNHSRIGFIVSRSMVVCGRGGGGLFDRVGRHTTDVSYPPLWSRKGGAYYTGHDCRVVQPPGCDNGAAQREQYG
jgi:hypothetical protein